MEIGEETTNFPFFRFNRVRRIKMKVRRKFNLGRIGHQYESIEIEVEGNKIDQLIQEIEEAWEKYCRAIVDGKVQ